MKYNNKIMIGFLTAMLLTFKVSAYYDNNIDISSNDSSSETNSIVSPTIINDNDNDNNKNGWTLSLNGSANTAFNNTAKSSASTGIGIGHSVGTLILPFSVGVRQNFGYASPNYRLYSKVYGNWKLYTIWKLELDGGVNVGTTYGQNTPFVWSTAPELTSRYYLTKRLDVFYRAEFPFKLNGGSVKGESVLGQAFGIRYSF